MTSPGSTPILIVEDEPKIAQLLIDYLTKEAYTTHWLTRGNEVVSWIQQNDSQLILLDVMLPGKDGIDICREIRTFSDIPIIMITARIEEIDRLLGLELGADDYICKPFSPREVVARVKTILRRIANQQALGTGYLGLEINEEQHRATIDGHILNLTPVEFRLLSVLFSQPGRVYSRNQLLNQIFDDSYIISDRTIDSHIKNLRKKVRELHPREDIVQTVYGVGYKLE